MVRISASRDAFSKTQMCPHLNIPGGCRRGACCNFAHAATELRSKPDLRKTRLCDKFMQTGQCDKGVICEFAHGEKELRHTTGYFKTDLCKYWKAGKCHAGHTCRHAHGVKELRARKFNALEIEELKAGAPLSKICMQRAQQIISEGKDPSDDPFLRERAERDADILSVPIVDTPPNSQGRKKAVTNVNSLTTTTNSNSIKGGDNSNLVSNNTSMSNTVPSPTGGNISETYLSSLSSLSPPLPLSQISPISPSLPQAQQPMVLFPPNTNNNPTGETSPVTLPMFPSYPDFLLSGPQSRFYSQFTPSPQAAAAAVAANSFQQYVLDFTPKGFSHYGCNGATVTGSGQEGKNLPSCHLPSFFSLPQQAFASPASRALYQGLLNSLASPSGGGENSPQSLLVALAHAVQAQPFAAAVANQQPRWHPY